MWVKICGTTNLADALLSIEHGADALGFIFAPSKRQVSPEQAAAIICQLPPAVELVGVFTKPDAVEIAATVQLAQLTAVQLHMPHDPSFTARLQALLGPKIRLIQVLIIQAPTIQAATEQHPDLGPLAEDLAAAFQDASLWAVLLDAASNGQSGGLGRAFSWLAVRPVLAEAVQRTYESAPQGSRQHPLPDSLQGQRQSSAETPKVLLAGGLHAENVSEAILLLQPWGVDCVSGVEQGPGHKDPALLTRFLVAAKA